MFIQVTAIDPLLLAVPLPILPLATPSTSGGSSTPTTPSKHSSMAKSGKVKKDGSTQPVMVPRTYDFEHSFPSSVEMKQDSQVRNIHQP